MNSTTAKPIDDARGIFTTAGPQALRDAVEPKATPTEKFLYDGTRYHLDTGKAFVPMDARSVTRHLKRADLSPDEIADALCDIQTERFIDFAGPLAGKHRGLHEAGGHRLLATTSPQIIQASPGGWQKIKAVFDALLYDETAGKTQIDTFLAWLKFARESLLSGKRRPGQAMALAGPRGCGKSLLIDLLEMAMGSRRANPYPYFTGRTNFNADLAGAELLAVDDEAGSTDIRARKALAANIKSNLFSGAVRIEGKHRCGFTFRPVWRMVIALNDEPENLLVLPPITEDIADKITLLRCHKRAFPMPCHTLDERERFFATLRDELPALLHWLDQWEPPADLRDERCGVAAYHHPELLAGLHSLSPEGQLADLIDSCAKSGGISLPWTGTAAELKAVLCGCHATARDAERLLGGWLSATGSHLGRLEGNRVEKLKLRDGVQRWMILPSGPVD